MSIITLKQFQQDAVVRAVRIFHFMRDVLNQAGANDDARALMDGGSLISGSAQLEDG